MHGKNNYKCKATTLVMMQVLLLQITSMQLYYHNVSILKLKKRLAIGVFLLYRSHGTAVYNENRKRLYTRYNTLLLKVNSTIQYITQHDTTQQ